MSKLSDTVNTKILSMPESLITFGSGAAIPFVGITPALSGAIGGIGMSRLHKRSPQLQHFLGKFPGLSIILGTLAGYELGRQLSPHSGVVRPVMTM